MPWTYNQSLKLKQSASQYRGKVINKKNIEELYDFFLKRTSTFSAAFHLYNTSKSFTLSNEKTPLAHLSPAVICQTFWVCFQFLSCISLSECSFWSFYYLDETDLIQLLNILSCQLSGFVYISAVCDSEMKWDTILVTLISLAIPLKSPSWVIILSPIMSHYSTRFTFITLSHTAFFIFTFSVRITKNTEPCFPRLQLHTM